MDILSKLPFINADTDIDTEVDQAQSKKARIAFHRESVRNGPTKFKSITTGQVRRANQRLLRSQTKRARRKQVQDYFAQQRFVATLRGNLQAVGILPYATEGFTVPTATQDRAERWLLETFDGDTVEARIKDAVETYHRLTMPVAR